MSSRQLLFFVGLAGSTLAAAALVAGCSDNGASSASGPPAAGASPISGLGLTVFPESQRKAVPDIAGQTLTGGHLSLADLRGKTVVLNAWASWCEPCREELPELVSTARGWHGGAVAFVGLNVSDSRAAASGMVSRLGVSYPSIIDPAGRTLARIPGVPAAALPSTVVIDGQGRVAARIIGPVNPGVLRPVLASVASASVPSKL